MLKFILIYLATLLTYTSNASSANCSSVLKESLLANTISLEQLHEVDLSNHTLSFETHEKLREEIFYKRMSADPQNMDFIINPEIYYYRGLTLTVEGILNILDSGFRVSDSKFSAIYVGEEPSFLYTVGQFPKSMYESNTQVLAVMFQLNTKLLPWNPIKKTSSKKGSQIQNYPFQTAFDKNIPREAITKVFIFDPISNKISLIIKP